MKNKWIILAVLVVLLTAAGGVLYYILTPHTPEDYYERLQKRAGRVPAGDIEKTQQLVGEYEQTRLLFEEKFPGSDLRDDLLFEQARLVDDRLQDATTALTLYKEFIEVFPESNSAPQALFRSGEILFEQEQYLASIETFRKLIQQYPEQELADDTLYQLGLLYEHIGEYPAALSELRRLIADYPDSPLAAKAQLKIASILGEKMDQRKEALEEIQTLQEAYPGSEEAGVGQSMGQSMAGEVAEEEAQASQEERYGARLHDHALSFQQLLEEAGLKEVAAQGLDIQRYDLEAGLQPDEEKLNIRARVHLLSGPRQTDTLTFLFGRHFHLDSVHRIDSTTPDASDELFFKHEEDLLAVRWPEELQAGQSVSLRFDYSADWVGMATGAALSSLGQTQGGLLPDMLWYPAGDFSDRSVYQGSFTVPRSLKVVSIGQMSGELLKEDSRQVTWEAEVPFWGITFGYAPFQLEQREIEISGRRVDLSCYVLPESAGQAEAVLDELERILRFYSELFVLYPYNSFKAVQAPWLAGGFGSPTLVYLAGEAFTQEGLPWLLAHETSHQWWGNLIGYRADGQGIPWQVEGFATYSDLMYSEAMQPENIFRRMLFAYAARYYEEAFRQVDTSLASVSGHSPLYQAVVYQKGALVLHALRYVMGDEAFFAALKAYAERYSFKSPAVEDYRAVCEEFYNPFEVEENPPEFLKGSTSLEWFFDQWIYRAGIPIWKIQGVRMLPDDQGFELRLEIIQDREVYTMPCDLVIRGAREEKRERIWLTGQRNVFTWQLPWAARSIELDPGGWIIKNPKPEYLRWEIGQDR